jgi:hypothetical protein
LPVYIFGPSCRSLVVPLLLFPLAAANPSAWPSSQQLLSLAAAQASPCSPRVRPQPAPLSAQLWPVAHAPLPPAIADMWDPPVIPYLKPYPTVTPPPPPPESVPCTHSHAWPARQGPPRPLFKPPSPPGAPTRNPSRHRATAPRHPNPSQAPPPSSRRLTVDGKPSGSFARLRASRRCRVCTSPTSTAPARPRWSSTVAAVHPFEPCLIFTIGEPSMLLWMGLLRRALRFGENREAIRAR